MSKIKVYVREQEPMKCGSIYCLITLRDYWDSEIYYRGQLYFVCDLDRNIIQYYDWMIRDQRILKQLRGLGYKFNGK